jgi:ethanolamine permease
MMASQDQQGGVRYVEVGADYFEKRGLRRYAGVWSLWALGVGAVISGDFFGWNFGLTSGGFGGLLIATLIITVMYLGLCYSIAEMSPALPHTGGAYSFGRSAIGPWGGFLTGLGENIEYVLTPAVIVVGIGGYLGAIFGTPEGFAPVWWAISYIIFVGLNIWGVEVSFRFTILITFLALAILLVFYIGALPHFDFNLYALNIGLDPQGQPVALEQGGGPWLPKGLMGIAAALPFAIWFYLAIEELPLAAEESHAPQRDMPRGILLGILTLIITAFLTLFLNAGIAPGSFEVGGSNEPLFLGFKTIFGEGIGAKILALIAVAGLIASFHTIIYAYGRNIYSLSRAGYLPHWLSVTHGERRTPHVALIVGAVIGFVVACLIQYSSELFGGVPVGGVLLNMAVFGAVISYAMQMLSFILLRQKLPNIERPYVSSMGLPGAWAALIIALVTLLFLFLNTDYRVGVVGCAIWYGLAVIYFAVYARQYMVRSPEEEFALEELRKEAERRRGTRSAA